jgi:WhiB family transcriptional regulator, redox-sensing transcriptional regulator
MKLLPNVPARPRLDRAGVARLTEGNWWIRAACQSAEPDLFFPISSAGRSLEQVAEAKAVCARCLVRRQCLAFALRTGQMHGVWGGMTEEERIQKSPDRDAMNPSATALPPISCDSPAAAL